MITSLVAVMHYSRHHLTVSVAYVTLLMHIYISQWLMDLPWLLIGQFGTN